MTISLEKMEESISDLDLNDDDPLHCGLLVLVESIRAVDGAISSLAAEQKSALIAMKAAQKQFAADVATDVLSVIHRDIDQRVKASEARLWQWVSVSAAGGLTLGVALGCYLAITL